MKPIVIELAGQPKGKGRARFARATGRAYTPANTRQYEGHLRLAAQAAMVGRDPIDKPVTMAVQVSIPIPASWSKSKQAEAKLGLLRPTSRPDADNYLKAAADALNEIVFSDDSLVVDAHVSKFYSAKPGMRIEVAEWSP